MNIHNPIIRTSDIIVIGNIDNSIISKDEPEKWSVNHISGLTYSLDMKPTYYNFCDSLNFTESFIEDLSGQWVAVLGSKNNKNYKVVTDHFGFQSVFYRYDRNDLANSKLVISTSYSALLQYSKEHGLPCNMNEAQFYLAMSSSTTLMRSAFSTKTFCKEISLLGANEYLIFEAAKSNLKVKNKAFLYDVHNRSFDELIDTGIEKSIQKVKSLSNFYDDKRIYLSGGRDSRMVLGLLKSAGLTSSYTVASGNPRNAKGEAKKVIENDLHVSQYLTQRYQMGFSEERENYCRINLGFEQSLDRVLSHSSQLSWSMQPNNRVTFPSSEYLSLRGGGGELFRATSHGAKAKALLKKRDVSILNRDIKTQAEALFSLYVNLDSIPKEYHEECRQIFYNSFIFDESKSLDQNIDWHFLHYRNRIHFGHLITSYSKNEITHHPLMQKEFLFASAFYDLESRRNDLICHDILNRLEPELKKISFDNGYSECIPEDDRLGPSLADMAATQDYSEYYDRQKKNILIMNKPIDLNNHLIENIEIFSRYKVYLLSMNMLFEFFIKKVFDAYQVESIVNNIFSGNVSPTELYLKSIQYKNLEEHYFVETNLVTINNNFEKRYLNNIIKDNDINLLDKEKSYYKHLTCSLIVGENIEASIYLSDIITNHFTKVEYAYYLYENGKVLEKYFYTPENSYTYSKVSKGAKYSVIFFLKLFLSDTESVMIRVRSDSVS